MLALALFAYLNVAFVVKGGPQTRGAFEAYYDLQEDIVDVVYIGASSASRFYVNPKAFHDEGIASYTFGPNGSPTYFQTYLIEEAERTQDPSLYILDLRGLRDECDEVSEGGIRKTLDMVNLLSPSRVGMARLALKYTPSVESSMIDYLFPIAKYHSRLVQGEMVLDDFLLKFPYNDTQGFRLSGPTVTQRTVDIRPFDDDALQMADDMEEVLCELVDYCDGLGKDVLFVLSPGSYKLEEQARFNAACAYVASRGYPVINCVSDEVFAEIGLDWDTDFYDNHHTNYLGAIKYTEYLDAYLKEHYNLPDRRNEQGYEAWEEGYSLFCEYTAEGILHRELEEGEEDE